MLFPSTTQPSSCDRLDTIFSRLRLYPYLLACLTLSNIHQFIVHAALLKRDIYLAQPSAVSPMLAPEFLPYTIQLFLSQLVGVPAELVPTCWSIFKDLIWDDRYVAQLRTDTEDGFRLWGMDKGLSA